MNTKIYFIGLFCVLTLCSVQAQDGSLEVPQIIASGRTSGFSQNMYTWVIGDGVVDYLSVVIATDLDEEPIPENPYGINLIGNPVKEQIKLEVEQTTELRYTLFNLAGQAIKHGRLEGLDFHQTIDVNALPAQMYILHIRDRAGQLAANFKVVKQ